MWNHPTSLTAFKNPRGDRKEGVGTLALPLAWSTIGVWREKVVSWLFLGDSHLHTLPIVQWELSLDLRRALLGHRRLLWEQHQVTRGDHSGYEWLALERINDWVGVVRCVCLNWVLVISKASFIENIVFIHRFLSLFPLPRLLPDKTGNPKLYYTSKKPIR